MKTIFFFLNGEVVDFEKVNMRERERDGIFVKGSDEMNA